MPEIKASAVRQHIETVLSVVAATKHNFPIYALEKDQLPAIKIYTPRDDALATLENGEILFARRRLNILIQAIVSTDDMPAAESDELADVILRLIMADVSMGGNVLRTEVDRNETEIAAEGQVPVSRTSVFLNSFYTHDFSAFDPGVPVPGHVWIKHASQPEPLHETPYEEIT